MHDPQSSLEFRNPGLSGRRGLLGFWLNLTAPPQPYRLLDIVARERLRKAELTSYSILAVFVFLLTLVSNSLADPSTAQAVIIMAVGLFIAAVLNRTGRTRTAAYLVPTLLMVLIALAVAGGIGLDVIALPAYDLFVIPIFLSSLTGNRRAPWFFGLAAIAFIAADFFLQPHLLTTATTPPNGSATNFDTLAYYTTIFTDWGMINRHVALSLFAALFGWLGARSVEAAILRADRAEELAELERREIERTKELEEGVRQLLAVHVHLANGDFNVRSPAIRNSLLWQIGSSLNNLIARLGRLAQADFVLRRTQEEANRVTEAIYMLNSGRQPIWPAASNTPLDRLVDVLRTTLTPRVGGAAPMGQLPPSPGSGYPGGGPSSPIPGPNTPPAPMSGYPDRPSTPYPNSQPGGSNAVPDWMRTLMANDGSGQPPMQPMQPPSDPRSAIPGPASGYGAPGQGHAAQPPQPNVNPWMLDGGNSGEPLDDSDLPEWLRHPNADR
jgi:hypothetical protein